MKNLNFLFSKIILTLFFSFFSSSIFSQTSGGPDLFGYTWFNSDDPNGPVYNWIDINSLPGTIDVTGLADDNIAGPFPLQIPFEYYGTLPFQFWIGSNGYLGFSSTPTAHPFQTIPSPNGIQNYLAVMVSDLTFKDSAGFSIPGAECKYWLSPGNDSLIVTWKEVPFWTTGSPGYSGLNSFQVILSAINHSITFQYLLQSGTYNNPTNFMSTGIENNTGSIGLQVLYDTYPVPGTSVLFNSIYNSIKGKAFVDLNNNSVQDINENPVANHQITEQNTGRIAFTEANGNYSLSVSDSGNYSTYPSVLNYFNAIPSLNPAYFNGLEQTDSLNDFAFQSSGTFNDLCVTITPTGNFRMGFNASYMINYENAGTTTLNGTVIFFPDDDVTYVSSNPAATSVTTDSIVWDIGSLTPFQTGSISVTVNVNLGTPVGTLINSSVVIEPVAGDANTSCNYNSWEVFVTGSFDPNAILVDRDTILTTELLSPPYLNYIIYFQNTGNDTAFNIKIMNNISQKLDFSTFEFVAASHPVHLTYTGINRDMKFIFNNVLLPDSNVNEPASHGFIRYRIKPLSTLVAGNQVKNNATIYFDFNQPVMTDTAVTVIVLPTGAEEAAAGSGSKQLIVYPNPANDKLIIDSYLLAGKKAEMKIYDLYGREVFQLQTSNFKLQTKIDVSRFSQGIYFVELQSGEQVLRGKFLKE